ncbi:unnamed protein product [Blepharisma stoltei]|uniref:UBX domain-containing protein n=1 Tax=Blepharisma stoltei TaxID=1481888 RepID=A0AAU9IHM1_9CILI|nr:unnamed protein product [Blepharisma stoltei]
MKNAKNKYIMRQNSLTREQEEALMNFSAITECWDSTIAMNFLLKNNWDLMAASNDFISLSTVPQPIPAKPHIASPQPKQSPVPREIPESSPSPNKSWRSAIKEKAKYLSSSIKSYVWNVWNQGMPVGIRGEESSSARAFVSIIKSFNTTHPPPFSLKHLPDILTEAMVTSKPLFLFINSSNIEKKYLSDIICHEIATAYISESYLAWGVNQNSADGEMVTQMLNLTNFPCCIIVRVYDVAMPIVIERLEGIVTLQQYLDFLDRNMSPIAADVEIPSIDPVLYQERIIREQQDQELREAEALVRERYKSEEIKRNLQKKKEEEERQKKVEEEEERSRKLDRIGEEPELGPDISQISIRLPDGKKAERRFHKSTQVGVLYEYIETLGVKDFEIVAGFPSKILDDKSASLETSGLFPKALVHIRETSLL